MNKLLAAALLLCPAVATAAQGEVCLADPVRAPGTAKDTVTDETVFACATAGRKTIPELYKAGWRVVTLWPQAEMEPMQGAISTRWTLIVEKP